MGEKQYQWQYVTAPDAAIVQQVMQDNQLTEPLAQLLVQRGYTSSQQIQQVLKPDLSQLHDPFLFQDMQRAVERIQQAIMANEKITVYGDYDADGVTSTSLMQEALSSLGADVATYLPNRFQDGYGPNMAAYEKIAADGTKLLITVDNGVSGKAEIAAIQKLGVDVIVTDHHELPPELPDAYAIIHPRLPGTTYPFDGLSGVGVAFKVATALLDEIPVEMLDLVAIGTVCDLVPLTDENRILVYYGLQQLQQSTRPGIMALCEVAGIDQSKIDEQSIGFGIGPRLNALGRLGDAQDGVALLTTFDPDKAQQLATFVQSQNQKRQALVKEIAAEALKMAQTPENQQRQTLVLAHKDWHEGVLGIVASQVVGATHKPTLILNIAADGTAKGSGRSVEAFHLFNALDQQREQLLSFGGHHMAVGLTVAVAQLPAVQAGLEAAATEQKLAAHPTEALTIDLKLAVNQVTPDLLAAWRQLAPFGVDNPQPVVAITPEKVDHVQTMGAEQQHLKCQLHDDQTQLTAIGFQQGQRAADLEQADQATFVGSLGTNEWQGRTTLQLLLKDFDVAGQIIIDQRTSHLTKQLFQYQGTYVFFHASYQKALQPYLSAQQPSLLVATAEQVTADTLILVDLPHDLSELQHLLAIGGAQCSRIITLFYTKQPVYLDGLPQKQDFQRLFKFVWSHHDVDVRHQSAVLAKYLQIKEKLLIFMIQVFFELGFVKIENGVLNRVDNPAKQDLTQAPVYQKRMAQMAAESTLIYSNYQELKGWFAQQ
jgi:single-stranded-DNA-specific exonuclease